MFFCKPLKTTTTARNNYSVVTQYLTENGIPFNNFITIAADGAPAVMGRHNGELKLLKNNNTSMMSADCIIHRENMVAAAISCELNQLLKKGMTDPSFK